MDKVYEVSASIVVFNNDPIQLKRTIDSFLTTSLKIKLFLVDNSPTPALATLANHASCEYIFNYGNLGFGKAHNIAFEKVIDQSEFHLVLNPDVSFDTGTLEKIYAFMKAIKDVGLLLPKVYNENNELQYLAKLLPNPMDLIFRRFLPEYLLKTFKRHEEFELRSKNYDLPIEAPYLSGCFMFLRVEALREVGFFDPRFFMYMEDVDLSRRIHSRYRTVYFPEVMIVHGHEKASYKNFKLLKIHIISGIRYFNKYGWFFDAQRRKINNLCVRKKQDLNPFS